MQNSAKQLLTLRWIQPCVGCYHLHPPSPFSTVLITSKADTHRTIPWRIGGWVNLGTAIHSYLQWDLISCTAVIGRHFTWQCYCLVAGQLSLWFFHWRWHGRTSQDHLSKLRPRHVSALQESGEHSVNCCLIITSSCFNLVVKNNVLLV